MVINICVLELLLLHSGAVDTKVTGLWSLILSYNPCSHVSLVLSSTLVAQRAKIYYLTNGAGRAPSLSERSMETRQRLSRAFWLGRSNPLVPGGIFLLGSDFARQVPALRVCP